MRRKETRHVVFGGHGAVGAAVLGELRRLRIVGVSAQRSPPSDPDGIQADLTDRASTIKALENASHAYICVGLPYRLSVWQKTWPVMIDNVISAAADTGTDIIFLDNIYMYGPPPLRIPITEEHPQEPSSKKGAVRKKVAETLLDAHGQGKIKAVIGRAPHFYGPRAVNSLLYVTVLKRMLAGQAPQWMGDPNLRHAFVHVGDAGRALVELALTPDSFGSVWHLPVATPPPSLQMIVDQMGAMLNRPSKIANVSKSLVKTMSPFAPLVKEAAEMAYQSENDYVFSSDKFMKRFSGFYITPYEQGIAEMVWSFQNAR